MRIAGRYATAWVAVERGIGAAARGRTGYWTAMSDAASPDENVGVDTRDSTLDHALEFIGGFV